MWPSWRSGADSTLLEVPASTRPLRGANWPFGTSGSLSSKALGAHEAALSFCKSCCPSSSEVAGSEGAGESSPLGKPIGYHWLADFLGLVGLCCGFLGSFPPAGAGSGVPKGSLRVHLLTTPHLLYRWPLNLTPSASGRGKRAVPERHRKGWSPIHTLVLEAPGMGMSPPIRSLSTALSKPSKTEDPGSRGAQSFPFLRDRQGTASHHLGFPLLSAALSSPEAQLSGLQGKEK